MNKQRFHISLALFVCLLLSTGCAVYEPAAVFTKQRYTNVVSYFNTFYNAQRAYLEAEDAFFTARREYNDRGNTAAPFVMPSAARQKFQTSIEKNSKVLSFYPESKWVDDALLMIGKAYFYMQDDVRAERKFLELAAQFPNSSRIPESRFWLGRSLFRQKKYQAGQEILESVISSSASTDSDLSGRAAHEIGTYYFSIADYAAAGKYFAVAADRLDDAELRAQTLFQIGRCFLETKDYRQAELAFASAADASPYYTLLFQAQLQMIKAQAFQERYDDAEASLESMLRDSKNIEFAGIIHFEIGKLLEQQGKLPDAMEKYRYIDTAFARTDVAAQSYFRLGKYYETVEVNYDSALSMYQKAKTEFAGSEVTPLASQKYDIYLKYVNLRNDMFRIDSLSLQVMARNRNDAPVEAIPDSVDPSMEITAALPPPVLNLDSVRVADSLKAVREVETLRANKQAYDSLQLILARTKFELGGLFFLEVQRADSSLYWFTNVVRMHPTSEFVPRALYTIAEIQRTMLQAPQQVMDSIYRIIIARHSQSPYANEARRILGLPRIETETDSARVLFETADSLAEAKKVELAVRTYKTVAERFTASAFSPKALYAAGWHYEHTISNNDSAYALYKRLTTSFPASQYSALVRAKVSEFEIEKKRLEAEAEKEREARQAAEASKNELKTPSGKKIPGAAADSAATQKKKL